MPPRKRAKKEPAETKAPPPPAVEPGVHVPFSCGECESIYQQEGAGAFLATNCIVCTSPVWFRSGDRYREYRAKRAEALEAVE